MVVCPIPYIVIRNEVIVRRTLAEQELGIFAAGRGWDIRPLTGSSSRVWSWTVGFTHGYHIESLTGFGLWVVVRGHLALAPAGLWALLVGDMRAGCPRPGLGG